MIDLPEPAAVATLPVEELPAVLAQLAALQSAVAARLADRPPPPPSSDETVDVDSAARLLGMSPSWLYRHAKQLPFTRRVGRRALRFSVAGIQRYLVARRPA
jgi:predicted DNA-binding transcriptional regulator AlpA